MITINNQEELNALLNDDGNLIVKDNLTININIDAQNIKARNINARNINARDIDVWNIDAGDINAQNIKARNIDARNINVRDIDYYAVCFAYGNITCKSIKGSRENSKHFCLDGEITESEGEST